MPQLLNHLQVDSLEESVDWGTLVVYTCAQSCGDGSSYQTEFIWKQKFADTGIPTTALGTGWGVSCLTIFTGTTNYLMKINFGVVSLFFWHVFGVTDQSLISRSSHHYKIDK